MSILQADGEEMFDMWRALLLRIIDLINYKVSPLQPTSKVLIPFNNFTQEYYCLLLFTQWTEGQYFTEYSEELFILLEKRRKEFKEHVLQTVFKHLTKGCNGMLIIMPCCLLPCCSWTLFQKNA